MNDTDKEQNMEENGEPVSWESGVWDPPDEEPPTGPEEESGTRFSFSDKRKIKKETSRKKA